MSSRFILVCSTSENFSPFGGECTHVCAQHVTLCLAIHLLVVPTFLLLRALLLPIVRYNDLFCSLTSVLLGIESQDLTTKKWHDFSHKIFIFLLRPFHVFLPIIALTVAHFLLGVIFCLEINTALYLLTRQRQVKPASWCCHCSQSLYKCAASLKGRTLPDPRSVISFPTKTQLYLEVYKFHTTNSYSQYLSAS